MSEEPLPGDYGPDVVIVSLRWGDQGPEIGKAIVNFDTGFIDMQVLDPHAQEILGNPNNVGLFNSSIYSIDGVVQDVQLFANAGNLPQLLESEKQMSDTSNNQFPTSSEGDTEAEQPLASESSSPDNSSSTDPETTSTDGISTDTESTSENTTTSSDLESDELGADPVPDEVEVGPGNPTLVDDGSAEESSETTSSQSGDASESTGTTEAQIQSSLSDNESGDASEMSSTESSDESQTSPSNVVDSDGATDGDASELNSAGDPTSTSGQTSGISITDVPGSADSSTPVEDGSTLGDPELPVESTPQEPVWPAADELPDGVEVKQVEVPPLLTDADIKHRFGFHKAAIEGPDVTTGVHATLRKEFKGFAEWLNNGIPASREAALMFTALEEASMWAHKAVAKNEPIVEE